ncbi:hypothetical protein KOI40_01790 [Aestuariicella sp. G3-2]|uniref:hypothetical protein n=1 Tax=Pseudomaricurvus albidus TaxID=2842452 RepID=UPI001C0B06BB|nr:hypothetical protein [Aestuariicella albida]MBU3068528.1 hypothetical protein [Aestuariicella albida]
MNQDVLEDRDDREERLEDHTVDSRKKLREQLQSEVEAFLARGGQIQTVDPSTTSDPPQKPSNNYCSRPI